MRLRLLTLSVLVAACAHHAAQSIPRSGHGAISLSIAPNPIVAQPVSGRTANLYEFPFDIVVRETGGHPLTINGVSLTVYAFGLPVNADKYDSAQIAALGFPTDVPANGELRYHLHPRRAVTDERLFSSISAAVRIDATDDTATPTTASTTVSVSR
jgi:hypothetical protein